MDKVIETVYTGSRFVSASIKERSTGVRYLLVQGPFGRSVTVEKDKIQSILDTLNGKTN